MKAENKEVEQEKNSIIKSIKEMYKKNKNLMFITLFIGMFVFYGFSFISPYLFSVNKDSLLYTEVKTDMELGELTVSINNWSYSPEEALMEVDINIDNENSEGISFNCAAMSRETGNTLTDLEADVIYSSSSYLVIFIKNIPERFNEVLLDLESVNNNLVDSVSFYTNKFKVKNVDYIKEKEPIEYQIDRLESNMDSFKSLIDNCNKQIKNYQKNNSEITKEIEKLRGEEQYLTTEEIRETESKISNYENEFKNSIEDPNLNRSWGNKKEKLWGKIWRNQAKN